MEDPRHSHVNPFKITGAQLIPLVLILLVGFAFFPSLTLLYGRWTQWDEGMSHGLMIVGFFIFSLIKSSPWPIHPQSGLITFLSWILLALTSLLWFLADVANIHLLGQLALIPAFILVITIRYGWRTAYAHKWLLLLPIFAIPVWDLLNNSLVNLSSLVVGKWVQLINMPAVIDGNSIFIPFGHILIADGCSGIRYFVISLALGYIVSYLNHYSWRNLLITLVIAAFLGLLANWLRIFILVVVGYETQMQSALMSDHEYFGWALFALIGFPAIYFAPVVKKQTTREYLPPSTTPRPILMLSIIAGLAIGPLLNAILNEPPVYAPLKDLLSSKANPIPVSHMPLLLTLPTPAHSEHVRIDETYLQIDQYQRAAKQDKLVPYIARLYNNQEWTLEERQTISLGAIQAQLQQYRHKSSGRYVLQLQWFALAGTTTDSLVVAKLLQIPAQLRQQNQFQIFSLQTRCVTSNCETERTSLLSVANSLQDLLIR